jgi:hypothetical protein
MSRIINKRCDTCNTVVKYRTYWLKHCRTKKHLRNLKNLGCLEGTTDNNQNNNRAQPKTTEITTGHNRNNNRAQPAEYRCKYCNKEFKYQQSKSRHELYRCKEKQKQQETTQITNNTNSHNTNSHNTLTNTNNINNQITLNVYGEETIKKNFLTNDLFKKLELCNGDLSKIYLMLNEELYLKEKKNNNIKYTNIQSEYCQILSKNNNWILKRLLEVMNERGITVKNELERELERIIKEEGINTNSILPHPKIEKFQIMYTPLEKFEEEIDEEDEEIKELYKKYQIELYNLKKKRKKKKLIIEEI